MKESIQNKINKIQEIALASKLKKSDIQIDFTSRANDNLSKSIRDAKEAEIFYFELQSAVNLAKSHLKK